MNSIKHNILILGSFVGGALEHQYVRGFKKLGWDVCCFEMRLPLISLRQRSTADKIVYRVLPALYLKNLNIKIITTAKEIKPEIILVFKGMEIFPETLFELKKHTKLLCNYNPDHPFQFYSRGSGNRFVVEGIRHYDIYFSYSKSICDQLCRKYDVVAECVPFGFDETVSGSVYSKEDLSDKFVFIGTCDIKRANYFKKLSDFPVRIFGDSSWNKAKSINKNFYSGYPVYGNDYGNVSFSSRAVLNLLRPHNIKEQSHNMRTFEVPGYGGLMIANRTAEQLDFFEEDKEAVYYETLEELKDKLQFYMQHNYAGNAIKKNGYKRAQKSGYSYRERSCTLASIIKKNV